MLKPLHIILYLVIYGKECVLVYMSEVCMSDLSMPILKLGFPQCNFMLKHNGFWRYLFFHDEDDDPSYLHKKGEISLEH